MNVVRLIAVLTVKLVFFSATASAQSQPSCQSVGQDADGDGYGWVANPAVGEQPYSCIVDDSTLPAPSIVNKETNESVQLLRAYWDANVDLAGRNLECEVFIWNENDQRYILEESYQRYHYPLPSEKPWIYAWTKSNRVWHTYERRLDDETLLWTVVDGVLNELLTFWRNEPHMYWVELISVNGGTDNATRWWSNAYRSNYSADGYFQCTDPATNQFVPTGAPGVPSNAPSGVSTEPKRFVTIAEERESNQSGFYTSDGLRATMTRGGAWDIQELAYKPIHCPSYLENYYDSQQPNQFYWRYDDPADFYLMFLPPRADTPNTGFVAIHTPHWGGEHATASAWTINADNSIDHGYVFGEQDWFVLATTPEGDDALHYWEGGLRTCTMSRTMMDTPYTTRTLTAVERGAFLDKTNVDTSHCTLAEEARDLRVSGHTTCIIESEPTDSENAESENSGTCDYTNADLYDGWGWNSTTQQSCAPADADSTDRDEANGDTSSQNDNSSDTASGTDTAPNNTEQSSSADNQNNSNATTIESQNAEASSGGGQLSLQMLLLLGLLANLIHYSRRNQPL